MTRSLALGLMLLAAVPLSAPAQPRTPNDALIRVAIRGIAESARHPYLRWPDFPDYRDELEAFYGPIGYGLAWLENGRMIPQARDAIDALLGADRRGLNPDDYDANRLDSLWRAFEAEPGPPPDVQALVDVALTIGLFRHLSDLHIGRVNPANLNIGFNIAPKKYDLPALVRAAMATGRIPATIDEVQPHLLQYRMLLEVLGRYRMLADETPLTPLPDPGHNVEPGDRYEELPQLGRLLAVLGDLPDSAQASVSTAYEGEVVEAVKRFQARHGRTVDGVLGPATFASLNTPLAQRLEQIELALERLRWLPELEDERFIAVNVPAFRLWAVDPAREEGTPALSMRVVVGQALNKQTPVFMEGMKWLEFRPYWNIPYGITVREILPLIREDPSHLEQNGYEIVPEFGDDVRPLPASEENIEQLGSGQLKLRQRPGPKNSLGLVKFIFPNNAAVYLHDTPATQLFQRSRRDFSHGCIRVENPIGLAEFVLSGEPGDWTRDRIVGAMNGQRLTRVVLTRAIPVIIFYTTVFVTTDGTVTFYDDIYGHDRTLAGALAAGYPYPP
ncbi:MAG: L,D-transpeptidase family protein [Gemmatimonadota bacterium]|nr:MAG: L,D-transpeptidase family protein [Gemmatimonadota bacterium]